jgi:hypothetical protein
VSRPWARWSGFPGSVSPGRSPGPASCSCRCIPWAASTGAVCQRAAQHTEIVPGPLTRPAASRFIRSDLDGLLAGDHMTSFGLDRCCEGLAIVTAHARTHGVPRELSNSSNASTAGRCPATDRSTESCWPSRSSRRQGPCCGQPDTTRADLGMRQLREIERTPKTRGQPSSRRRATGNRCTTRRCPRYRRQDRHFDDARYLFRLKW